MKRTNILARHYHYLEVIKLTNQLETTQPKACVNSIKQQLKINTTQKKEDLKVFKNEHEK